MKYIKLIVLVAILTAGLSDIMTAKIRWSSGIGIRTFSILGDNPNAAPMIQRDSTKPQYIGGGFGHPSAALAIMGYATLGADSSIVIPFGFEYYEMVSRERIPIFKRTTAYLKNTIVIPSVLVGFNYKFYRFPIADVKAYIGVEINGFFNQSPELYRRIDYLNLDSIEITTIHPKKPAVRVGGDIKLGFEGRIVGPLAINANVGLGFQNLLFRDDNRGELYTPTRIEESKESLVGVFRIGIVLSYRF